MSFAQVGVSKLLPNGSIKVQKVEARLTLASSLGNAQTSSCPPLHHRIQNLIFRGSSVRKNKEFSGAFGQFFRGVTFTPDQSTPVHS